MAPHDSSQFSLRWEFRPSVSTRDGSIQWSWRAYTQAGRVFGESGRLFETLTECMEDARRNGYGA